MEALEPAALVFDNGNIRSPQFDDIYYSADDGLAETHHVFHDSIALDQAWAGREVFTIGETGFGTGLNFLATWREFAVSESAPDLLHYLSIEKHPISVADLERCHALHPELSVQSAALLDQYPPLVSGFHRLWLVPGKVCLTLLFMDAVDALDQLRGKVDCWFLDGFAPARNAAMWSEKLFKGIARSSRADTLLATFTAAGAVRRGLEDQGFEMQKRPGFGRKREMLIGRLRRPPPYREHHPWFIPPPCLYKSRRAVIVGAGIAGAQAAWHLAIRGWQVTVIEQDSAPGSRASGNPAAIVTPRLSAKPSIGEQFSVEAWLFQLRQLANQPGNSDPWHSCGALQLAYSGEKQKQWRGISSRGLPEELVTCVDASTASEVAGLTMTDEACWFRRAGWLEPDKMITGLLSHPNVTLRCGSPVTELVCSDGLWTISGAGGKPIATAPVVVIASGTGLDFAQTRGLPRTPVKGQTTYARSTATSSALKTIVQYDGYVLPADKGSHLLGATYARDDCRGGATDKNDQENFAALEARLPGLANSMGPRTSAHAALRMTSGNRLPLVGPVANHDDLPDKIGAMRRKGFQLTQDNSGFYPNLYLTGAHGSRGFTNAGLCGELIASLINDEPLPTAKTTFHAVHPARDLIKQLQRS